MLNEASNFRGVIESKLRETINSTKGKTEISINSTITDSIQHSLNSTFTDAKYFLQPQFHSLPTSTSATPRDIVNIIDAMDDDANDTQKLVHLIDELDLQTSQDFSSLHSTDFDFDPALADIFFKN